MDKGKGIEGETEGKSRKDKRGRESGGRERERRNWGRNDTYNTQCYKRERHKTIIHHT